VSVGFAVSPADDAFAAYRATRHFGSLDGIRCFSILAVIWHHTDHSWTTGTWARRGFLGVDMFFVLSGFLIVTLILREKDKLGSVSLKDFYVRRTLRIFPIYYGLMLSLASAYAVLKPRDADTQILLAALPYYLSYTCNFLVTHANNLGITWSLATEEQFYLLWPTVEKVVRGNAIFWVIGAVLVLNQLLNFGAFDPLVDRWYPPGHHPEIFDVTFTPIALGVLLAHLLHRRAAFEKAHALLAGRWAPIALSFALAIAIALSPEDIRGAPRLVIQLVMVLLLASVVVREDHVLARFLQLRPIVRIGAVSYGMYLFHMLVRHAVWTGLSRFGLEQVLFLELVIVAVATYVLAEISFRFYERPFLNLKRRFQR
jgi:peptidoglycan/LPS O-acetylase OafA/YrhL